MMFIVISVVEFGTKISSLLPILLDLCKNMKLNYFDISPSLNWDPTIFCPPHSLLFYLFGQYFNAKISVVFIFLSELRSLLVRLGKLKKVLRQYYIFRIILQWKYFWIFHISLWIEIPRGEVGQGVAPNGCNCITEYEVEKDFQSLLKYLRKKYLKR